jgi:4-diphosphocytidyl-2-C-methyl-D-erythritol kinase
MSVRAFAPAKINLTLEVGRPRADGLHPLQSVVAFAGIGDWIKASWAEDLSLSVVGPFAGALSAGADNLVLRAAHALAAAAGIEPRARIVLDKTLPIASGIGGGSSDAAAALRALNQLWSLEMSDEELARVGRPLGADVGVFFSDTRSALMRGVGEDAAPLRLPPLAAVLVNPLAPLATADVYRQFDRMGLGRTQFGPLPVWSSPEQVWVGAAGIGNDLAPAALALMPDIAFMLEAVRGDSRCRCAALSGSGATVFALAEDRDAAESLGRKLKAAHPTWWIQATGLAG